jgi:hypothetical protein
MKKLKKYLLWAIGSLFVFFLAVSAVVYFAVLRDADKIKNIVIGELNKSLTGEVSVERMNLTFWSSFPNIALDFRNVVAMGSNPNDPEPLLEAKRLSLNFNLRDMIAKKYDVKRIDLSGAIIRIKFYEDDTENFNLWKSTDTTTSNFAFALRRIQFRHTQLLFLNERSEQHYEFYFDRANARGDFSKTMQDIAFSGDFHLDLVQSAETIILANKKMSLRTQFRIDDAKTIHFLKGFVQLEDLNFDLLGFVNYSDGAPNMNLEVVGRNLNLQRFVQQLPTKFAQEIESYQTRGNFDFRMTVTGAYTDGNLPKIAAEWAFRDGQIYEKNTKTQLNQVQFSGRFSTSENSQLANSRLQIRDFSAYTESGHLVANFSINNFLSPSIQLNAVFSIDLNEFNNLVSISEIETMVGQSSGQVYYRHTFKNFDSIKLSEIFKGQFHGEISCRNVLVKLQDSIVKLPIKLDTIHFKFDQNRVQIPSAKGEFDGSRFQTSLVIQDFFEHLGKPELMYIFGDLSVDKYQVDNVLLRNLNGHIQFQKQMLFVENISVDVFDGNVNGVVEINFSNPVRFPFRFEGSLSKINAEKLFAEMDNFGQAEITDKNLKGLIDADFSAVGNYLPGSGLDMKSLWISMQTKISNGELNNVSMLQKLSRFVDEETLNHVKFATLENRIEIRNETITIPEMKIVSNALNLSVAGSHKFNGDIDYSIQIALSELLSRRRRERRQNREELTAVEDEKKRISLFVHVTGTTENPKFTYDFKNVFRNLELGSSKVLNSTKTAVRQEGKVVGAILRDEFHFLQKSEETKRQEELWRQQEQGKFVIEWTDEEFEKPENTRKNRRSAKKDTVKIGVVFEDD